jgi:hypothetical protein
MRPIFGKSDDSFDVERELVSQRPEPRRDFIDEVAAGLSRAPAPARFGRLSIAVVFTGLVLIGMASGGGVGYALSVASQAVKKVEAVVHVSKPSAPKAPSAAQAEYGPPTFPPPPPPPPTSTTPTSPPGTFTPPPTTTPKPKPKPKPPTSTAPLTPPSTPTSTGGTQGSTQQNGGLPFTGLSLWIPLLIGAGLVLLGVMLRRIARRNAS